MAITVSRLSQLIQLLDGGPNSAACGEPIFGSA